MTSERYVYSPLSESRQIRLLKIHSAHSLNDPENCIELVTTSLDEAPTYVALSYAWGNPLPKVDIYCSGSRLAVGPSLHNALRHLWPMPTTEGDNVLYLWADAVCINQEDIAERNAQIRIMSVVYATATKTAIWLGEEDEYVVRAFQWLTRFERVLEASEIFRPAFNAEGRSVEIDEQRGIISQLASDNHRAAVNILRTALGDPSLASIDAVFRDVWIMLNRAWFTRKWVLQEVCHSENLYLVAGRESIPWTALMWWFNFLHLSDAAEKWFIGEYPGNPERKDFPNYHCLSWLAGYWEHNQPLIYLLVGTLNLECSDPRDHLFSVSSIASDFGTFEALIDYELSVEELCDQITRACLARPADLILLWSSLSFIPVDRRLTKSWVPNLQEIASLDHRARSAMGQGWRTDLYESAHTKLDASPDGNILRVKGRIIDVIDELGMDVSGSIKFDQAKNDTSRQNPLKSIKALDMWLQDCHDVSEKAQIDLDGFLSALFAEEWRINFEKETIPAMRSVYSSYRSLLKELLKENNRESANKAWGNMPLTYVDIVIFLSAMGYRRFGRTRTGALGWMPKVAENGDYICIFDGIGIPYAIRKRGGVGGTYALVGECRVSGLVASPGAEMPSQESGVIILE